MVAPIGRGGGARPAISAKQAAARPDDGHGISRTGSRAPLERGMGALGARPLAQRARALHVVYLEGRCHRPALSGAAAVDDMSSAPVGPNLAIE
jgi:hypothetical protein